MNDFSIKIVCLDRTGLVSEISRIISDANFSVTSHRAVCTDELSIFNATLSAGENSKQISLIRKLHKIKGIKSIELK